MDRETDLPFVFTYKQHFNQRERPEGILSLKRKGTMR
jgi:hypothetical protein